MTRILKLTLAATHFEAMATFYTEVLHAKLEPAGGPFYTGRLGGLPLLLCDNAIAGVVAEQNRQQLDLEVNDLDATLAAVTQYGGTVRETTDTTAVVVDPDGNTLVLHRATRPGGPAE